MKKLILSIFLLATTHLVHAQDKQNERRFAEDKTISFLRFNSNRPKISEAQRILKDSLKLFPNNSFSLI